MNDLESARYIEENSGLVHNLVNKFMINSSNFSRDDLVQEGNLAFVRALKRFNPEDNRSKLSTYVYSAIYRELRDFVKKNKHDVKYSFHQQNKDYKESLKSEDFVAANTVAVSMDNDADDSSPIKDTIASGVPPALDKLIKEEQVEILYEEINELPEREKEVIMARFFGESNMADLARQQGCSRQRIGQISTRAMKRLTSRVKSRLGDELFV